MEKKNGNKLMDLGLLVLRLGIGGMFIFHGWPKISAGAASWSELGKAVSSIGINFGFLFWGFMAACAEFFGGVFLILGIGVRFFCALMALTMAVAAANHLRSGQGLQVASHAIEMGIVFFSLILIGPGGLSLDQIKNSGKKNDKKKK